ncbi:MAG: ABC transporter permease [Terriglobia bacterium]
MKRPQAALAIGSLIVGAAVCSLLLNLYGGVERKMTDSFRTFGANVVLTPRQASLGGSALPSTMVEPPLDRLQPLYKQFPGLSAIPALYVVMRVSSPDRGPRLNGGANAIVVGTDLAALDAMNRNWHFRAVGGPLRPENCMVGVHVAEAMQLQLGSLLKLERLHASASGSQSQTFHVAAILSAGSSEDDQVFVSLPALQRLASLRGDVSVVELRVPGSTARIEGGAQELARLFPETVVRPVRQIVYSEGKVLGTIRRLMLTVVALILVIIALCVAATMTAIVLERRKDIAVMKALGASDRLVMKLFLTESAMRGVIGGLVGFGIGALFARGLALRLFHVTVSPSWWTLPTLCVATMILAAVATLFPVRIVRRIQPADALKGA